LRAPLTPEPVWFGARTEFFSPATLISDVAPFPPESSRNRDAAYAIFEGLGKAEEIACFQVPSRIAWTTQTRSGHLHCYTRISEQN